MKIFKFEIQNNYEIEKTNVKVFHKTVAVIKMTTL